MLGLGGSLVPGANDGLLLLGLPLLYPHAWVAFASMLLTIAAALLVQQRATMARKPRLA
jgi:toxin CptA